MNLHLHDDLPDEPEPDSDDDLYRWACESVRVGTEAERAEFLPPEVDDEPELDPEPDSPERDPGEAGPACDRCGDKGYIYVDGTPHEVPCPECA